MARQVRRNQVKGAKKMCKRPARVPIAELKHLPCRYREFSRNAAHSRRYDLWPGAWNDQMGGHPWARIDLRIARTRGWMLREADLLNSRDVADDPFVQGCVIAAVRTRNRGIGRVVRGPRGRIASILLNERDLLNRPSEIISHEVTHAAMRFMELRGVNPSSDMVSEEALAYTVGELVKQANRIFYAHAFRQGP